MTPLKLTGFHKFVCFLLIAILLIFLAGFAVNGWQTDGNLPDSGDVGNKTDDTEENNTQNGNNEENSTKPDENPDNQPQDPPIEEPPPEEEKIVYINPITGLEVSEESFNSFATAILLDPKAPMYGVSDSDLSIEFPIEDGTSRLLTYVNSESELWKIGSIRPTRSFITAMTGFFGGIVVSYGKDDVVIYDAWETDSFLLDISLYSECYYVENTLHVYSSQSKIDLAISKSPHSYKENYYKVAPFDFSETDQAFGKGEATTVIIPYSDKNETEFYYHEKTGQYLYYKNANRKLDMLTGKNISYKNVFILFADSTTYEKAEGSELVIDITSGGKGYYITNGTYTEFTWRTDVSGELFFTALNGERLTVNPGNSYIGYYKASGSAEVVMI